MSKILFRVHFTAMDFDGTELSDTYDIFASNRADAVQLCHQILYALYGDIDDISIDVKPIEVSAEEKEEINHALAETFLGIKIQFLEMTYPKFIKGYINFQGYDFQSDTVSTSYWVSFLNFTFKVVFNNGKVMIDETEIYYRSRHLKRKYVLRNQCIDVYVGEN